MRHYVCSQLHEPSVSICCAAASQDSDSTNPRFESKDRIMATAFLSIVCLTHDETLGLQFIWSELRDHSLFQEMSMSRRTCYTLFVLDNSRLHRSVPYVSIVW